MVPQRLNVFRASAGSGKTFELTAQYISLLLAYESAQPRAILAVTFTQKATQEMKTRILEHLYDIAHFGEEYVETGNGQWSMVNGQSSPAPDGFLAKVMLETGQPADVLRRRAATALHAVLHNYDDFYVQTIDSFLQRLLRALAHELGLSAGYQVDIDDKETIHRAVDRLMEELPQHKQLLDWVTRFTMEHMEETGRWKVVNQVKDLAGEINKEAFAKDSDRLSDKLDNHTVGDYQRRLRAIRTAALQELNAEAQRLQPMMGDGKRFSYGGDMANYIANLCAEKPEFKEPGKRMQGFLASPDNWFGKNGPKNAALADEAATLHPLLVALEETRRRTLHTINSCDLSLKQLGELRLLGEIERLVAEINDESGRFLLSRTPLLFDHLVDDSSFVYERAGVQFRHVMIDEFQDTSTLQWHTFRRLIDESLAGGNSSMLVGDVKQSIYRWRNGDWETLAGIERIFRPDQLAATTLQTNYRSDSRIVAFNNAFFGHALAHPLFADHNTADEQSELRRIYDDVEQRTAPGKDEGFVRVSVGGTKSGWIGFEPEEEEQATPDNGQRSTVNGQSDLDPVLEDMAEQIRSLHDEGGVAYRDIAVLLRTNRDAVRIIQYLALHHPTLPLVSAEAFQLESSPAVQTVVAALRYLLHRSDTAAQVYLLHRYYTLVRREDVAWEELVSRRDELMPPAFDTERNALLRLPLYERCERIVALLELGRMEGQQDYLFCFLDGVKAFLQSERSDVELFLQHWDEKLCTKAIAATGTEGVQLLTVHKSKGLAFHTVLMPYVAWELCADSSFMKKNLLWCQPTEAPYSDMPLLPMEMKQAMADSIYKDAYTREQFRQRVENLNLLYVAFTRAVHNLYVWLDADKKDFGNSVGALVADFVLPDGERAPFLYTAGKLALAQGTSSENQAPANGQQSMVNGQRSMVNPLRTVPRPATVGMPQAEWRAEFRQSTRAIDFMADPDEDERQQREYINRGKLLHSIFEHIATASDAPAAVREAVQEGLLPADEEARTLAFVTQRVSQGEAAPWFDGTWALFRECTILSRTPDGTLLRRRPDRVMERDGQTLVVDFKFGKPRPEHAHQVSEYMDLLRQMGKPHVTGHVWYVLQNRIVHV